MAKRSRFEWLAEEEEYLFDAGSGSTHRRVRLWKRLGFWVVIVGVIVLLVSYALLDRRQVSLNNRERQDILNGFELWREAVINSDLELFRFDNVKGR